MISSTNFVFRNSTASIRIPNFDIQFVKPSKFMESFHTQNAPQAIGPYSQAVKHGQTLYISGQIGFDPTTGKFVGDDLQSQTEQVMKNIEAVLKAAGIGFSNVVKCSIFILDMTRFSEVNAIYSTYFKAPFPARETVQVSALPAGALVEISVIAAL
jgi:2-iminobutanoate/2-iminopropanoate deaminase